MKLFIKNLFTLALVFSINAFQSHGKLLSYMPAPEVKASEWFEVKANGLPVFVYDSDVAPFASVDTDEEVNLEIKSKKNIWDVDIRPTSLGITYTFSGNSIWLKVKKPCQFSVEINKMPNQEPLLFFVNPLETQKPAKGDSNVLYFEGGKVHKIGRILVKSGQTVYLEGGAVVHGFIAAQNASNIKIIGRGILNGLDNKTFMTNNTGMQSPEYKIPSKERFIDLRFCDKVTISGITLINPVGWQIVPRFCKDVLIDNVHLISEYNSDDGIDVVSSQNVTIQNAFIRTKDDNIVTKCDATPHKKGGTKNLLVQNCVLWNTIFGNNIEIGFELPADTVSDIVIKDIDVLHCDAGSVFSIHNTDFAVVRNVRLENIRIEDVRQKLFDFGIFLSKYSQDNPFTPQEALTKRYAHGTWDNAILFIDETEKKKFAPSRGVIENIFISNVFVKGGLETFSIMIGYDSEHTIRNIKIENLYIRDKKITMPEQFRLKTMYAEGISIR